MIKQWTVVGALILGVLLMARCQGAERTPEAPVAASGPVSAPGNSEPALPDRIEGTVVQTLTAGRYLYLELNTGTGSVWIAAMEQPAAKGDRVRCAPQTLMEKFESPILKRTFDRIYFVGPLTIPRNTGVFEHPSPHAAHGPDTAARGTENQEDLTVDVTPAEGGVTIADLAAQREKLAGAEVLLRGKVTQYNANIMGANWFHVRDRSDKRDLVVTTKAEVTVGSTVLIRGRLERDIDLGHGYAYDLLIRNADITIEKQTLP